MEIVALGVNRKRNPLFHARDEGAFSDSLVDALEPNAPTLATLTSATARGESFRSEAKRVIRDPADPKVAGWTFLVNAQDPRLDSLAKVLRPLAQHRGMADPGRPLMYRGEPPDEWFDWLHHEYYSLGLGSGKAPQYILVAGDPRQIPFGFQSVLAIVANVGRVDFDSPDDLESYVDKLLRLETARVPVVEREAIFFAPDAGHPDPTSFSREYMAKPMAAHVAGKLGAIVKTMLGEGATKEALGSALRSERPALVYTASHGLGETGAPLDMQKRFNGAICCQSTGPVTRESLFAAKDIPTEQPFLEGSIFFQFACFGYGTPAESDYAHWLGDMPSRYAEADFVAALPKKLLAHPRGPIAYIGHLDTAFLHGIKDVNAPSPSILERWDTRIAPFVKAVDELFALQPPGLAMQIMSDRYSTCNALLTSMYDRQRRGRLTWTQESKEGFLDRWITRCDAQNYMVLGDPAAQLRMP